MSELEARFRISLDGKDELTNFFEKSERSAKSFQSSVGNAMKSTAGDIARFGLSAAKSLAQIAGFQTSISGQAKSVLEFRDSIYALGTVAGISEDKLGGLKDKILSVSVASGQMKENVTEGLNAFVAKTGNIDEGIANLDLFGKTATATGAKMKEVAEISAQLSQKLNIKSTADQTKAFGIIAKQSDIGAIEAKDLAVHLPRIAAAGGAAGFKGESGLRAIGGLAQLFAEGVGGSGSAARVATSIEGVFSDVNQKQGKLKALGIEVGNRDPISILKDIVTHFHGDVRAISAAKLFSRASMRGIQTIAQGYDDPKGVHHAGYNETNGFAELDKFTNVVDDDTIAKKFALRTKSGLARIQGMRAWAEQKIDQGVDLVSDHTGLAAGAGVAGLLGFNLLKNKLTGGGGGGVLGLGGVQKVFVVNQPGGPGMPGGGGGGMGLLGKAGMVAGAGLAGYAAGTYLDDKFGISDLASDSLRAATGEGKRDEARFRAGVMGHAGSLAGKNAAKANRVSELEKQGYSHGQAVFGAEHPEQLVKAIRGIQRPVINVTIADGKATTTVDGTHSADTQVRRGAR